MSYYADNGNLHITINNPGGASRGETYTLGCKLDSAVAVDVSVLAGTQTAGLNGGTVTVSFPYTPKSGEDTSKLTVWHIDDDGTVEKSGGQYDPENKCFVFETAQLGLRVLVSDDTAVGPFTDVPENSFYFDAVHWAVANGVTCGTTATAFSPKAACTRAQAVTFLYRCLGE